MELPMDDTEITNVLSEIVERDVSQVPVRLPENHPGRGFPVAPHRGHLKQAAEADSKRKKKSMFAQQFSNSPSKFGLTSAKRKVAALPSDDATCAKSVKHTSGSVCASSILPANTMQEIQAENMQKLAQMSSEEILQEQQELMTRLDPSMVAFLKNRKTKASAVSQSHFESDQAGSSSNHQDVSEGSNVSQQQVAMETTEISPQQPVSIAMTASEPETPTLNDESEKRDWLNMDDIEPEKLAWMTDLPELCGEKVGLPARFDFQGRLISAKEDVPTHLGLHHHGDEPERAGYSLQELFTLARSTNPQQRRIGLATLSNIVRCARNGLLAFKLQTSILTVLLDAGLVPLMRWGLDDSQERVLAAAVVLLKQLICMDNETQACESCFSWPRVEMCCMSVPEEDLTGDLAGDEKIEQTDAEILKHDLIKGLLRMDLLPRLRYILEIVKPGASCVVHILDILSRISHHSPYAAYQVYKCPRLLSVIVKEFLPTSWTPCPDTIESVTYGYPVPAALRLLRMISMTGRNIANVLLNQTNLSTVISRYLTPCTTELGLAHNVSVQVQVQTCRLWTVLLTYGHATHMIRDLFPVLMVRLTDQQQSPEVVSSMVGVLEAALVSAADGNAMTERLECRGLAGPCLNWREMEGVIPTVVTLLETETDDFVLKEKFEVVSPPLLCGTIQLITGYLKHVTTQPGFDAKTLEQTTDKMEAILNKILDSISYRNKVSKIREFSNILRKDLRQVKDRHPSLPSVGANVQRTEAAEQERVDLGIENDEELVLTNPAIDVGSPLRLVTTLSEAVLSLANVNKSLLTTLLPRFVCEEVNQYVLRLSNLDNYSSMTDNYFTRMEFDLIHNLMRIASLLPSNKVNSIRFHQMAQCLLPWLPTGMDYVTSQIFTLMFREQFISDVTTSASILDIGSLSLNDVTPLNTNEISTTRQHLLSDVMKNYDAIATTFTEALTNARSESYKNSRCRFLGLSYSISSLCSGMVGQTSLPHDWMFLPLVHAYQQNMADSSSDVTPATVTDVTNCLRFVYLLESHRNDVIKRVSVTSRITRLYCCFLAGSDLFLETDVKCYLSALLREYTRPVNLNRVDWDQPVPGITSFYDLYVSLLEQFESVSFGDNIFSCYLLIPLRQSCNVMFRKALWRQHPSVLRLMYIPLDQVLIPLDSFLTPEEEDPDLIPLYCRALCDSRVRHQWSPLLYLSAVHHVNRYMYRTPGTPLRRQLLSTVTSIRDSEVRRHVIYYKQYDSESKLGFSCYDELPKNRQALIDSVT